MTLRVVSASTPEGSEPGGPSPWSQRAFGGAEGCTEGLWSELPSHTWGYETLAQEMRDRCVTESVKVSAAADRLLILFPESDFAARVESVLPGPGTRVSISVAVRAPAPSLETWWCEWTLACTGDDLPADLYTEVSRMRHRYRQMLAERFIGDCG